MMPVTGFTSLQEHSPVAQRSPARPAPNALGSASEGMGSSLKSALAMLILTPMMWKSSRPLEVVGPSKPQMGSPSVFIDEGAAAGAGVRSLDGHRPWTLGASNTVPRSTGVAACIGGPSEADTCRPRNPAGAVPGRVAGTVSGGADPALAVAGGLLRGAKELTWVVSRGAIRRRARGLVSSGAWEAEIGNDYLDSWHSHLRARERGERREGRQQGQRGEERCRSAFG